VSITVVIFCSALELQWLAITVHRSCDSSTFCLECSAGQLHVRASGSYWAAGSVMEQRNSPPALHKTRPVARCCMPPCHLIGFLRRIRRPKSQHSLATSRRHQQANAADTASLYIISSLRRARRSHLGSSARHPRLHYSCRAAHRTLHVSLPHTTPQVPRFFAEHLQVMPKYPSKHHCLRCNKSKTARSGKLGYCPKHEEVCKNCVQYQLDEQGWPVLDKNGKRIIERGWVKLPEQVCERCEDERETEERNARQR